MNSLFAKYPLRPAEAAAALGPTVVVVPHPDDEALGCGGLLALLRQAGQPVSAVLVSDGTMSHPNSRQFPPAARRAVRETELRLALSILGVDPDELRCLGLPDGQVPDAPDRPGFADAVAELKAHLVAKRPATVLVPWRRDPHPDHRATSQLVAAALAGLPADVPPPQRLEYLVWAWERAAPDDLPRPDDHVSGFRLAIAPVLGLKRRAIAAHRSQVAPGVFADDPDGFLLSEHMLAHFELPEEVYLTAGFNAD